MGQRGGDRRLDVTTDWIVVMLQSIKESPSRHPCPFAHSNQGESSDNKRSLSGMKPAGRGRTVVFNLYVVNAIPLDHRGVSVLVRSSLYVIHHILFFFFFFIQVY